MRRETDCDITDIGWINKALSNLAAAILERALFDYKNGTPELQFDAWTFLVEEDCGIWRDFLSLLPGWNKDFKKPGLPLTEEQKMRVVQLYRTCTLTLRQISEQLDVSYLAVRIAARQKLGHEEIDTIERNLLEYRKYWSLHDRLSGISCHDVGIRRHVSTERVTKWLREYLRSKGIKDTTRFMIEMNKKNKGKVNDECDRWLAELEKDGISWDRHRDRGPYAQGQGETESPRSELDIQ